MYSATSKILPSAAAMTAVIIVSLAIVSTGVPQTDKVVGPDVRVGIDGGDFQGADQRALQAAVDHVAGLGGGTVCVGP